MVAYSSARKQPGAKTRWVYERLELMELMKMMVEFYLLKPATHSCGPLYIELPQRALLHQQDIIYQHVYWKGQAHRHLPKKPEKMFSGGKGGQRRFAAFCSVLWCFAAFWGELATTTNAPQKYMTGNKMYHRCFGGSKKSNQTDREMLLQFVNIFATNDFMQQWTIPSCCPTHFASE